MSTLNVQNIQHPSSSTPAISLDSNGAMTGSFPYPNRNLIYNGAMQVHQRGTSTSGITSDGYFTADRWRFNTSGRTTGIWTQTVESDAPSNSGFSKSWKILTTTLDNLDLIHFSQKIEGQDLQRLQKGTSESKSTTISFWVKSNVTGTYIFEIRDIDNSRIICAPYTINSSENWEKKTITFDGDTTGTLDNDNSDSLHINWWLHASSNFTSGTLATSWQPFNSANRAVGQTAQIGSSVNNYWQITGVQLETGSVATEFEHRSYGDELARCQRYYQEILSSNDPVSTAFAMGIIVATNVLSTHVPFKTTMRTTPSLVAASGTNYYNFSKGTSDNFNSLTLNISNNQGARLYNNSEISQADNNVGEIRKVNATAYVAFDAEL